VLGRPLTPTQDAWVTAQVDALQPEVVLFNTPFCVPSGVDLPATVRATYVIALDVLSERAAAFEALGYGVVPSGFTPVVEADAMRDVSRVIAIQWDDAARFTELLPHAEVIVVPVSIEAPPPSGRLPVPHRCLFVGSGSLHNVDGMKWFLEECWPLVRAQLPSAELHVIGTVCARLGAAVDGVVLRGTVDDLSVEYEAASAVVVPLRAGSGLKVKLVEALCHRAAVVTTSVGAQGLMAVAPQPFAVGDGTADFTASLLEVLTDEARRHELVRRAGALAPQFSPARAYAELDASLSASGVRSPSRCRRRHPRRRPPEGCRAASGARGSRRACTHHLEPSLGVGDRSTAVPVQRPVLVALPDGPGDRQHRQQGDQVARVARSRDRAQLHPAGGSPVARGQREVEHVGVPPPVVDDDPAGAPLGGVLREHHVAGPPHRRHVPRHVAGVEVVPDIGTSHGGGRRSHGEAHPQVPVLEARQRGVEGAHLPHEVRADEDAGAAARHDVAPEDLTGHIDVVRGRVHTEDGEAAIGEHGIAADPAGAGARRCLELG
jgi:hypothetical protein